MIHVLPVGPGLISPLNYAPTTVVLLESRNLDWTGIPFDPPVIPAHCKRFTYPLPDTKVYERENITTGIDRWVRNLGSVACRAKPGEFVLLLDGDELVNKKLLIKQVQTLPKLGPDTQYPTIVGTKRWVNVIKCIGDHVIIGDPCGTKASAFPIGYLHPRDRAAPHVQHQFCRRVLSNVEPITLDLTVYNFMFNLPRPLLERKLVRAKEYMGNDAPGLLAFLDSLTLENCLNRKNPWPRGDGTWWAYLKPRSVAELAENLAMDVKELDKLLVRS